MEAHEEKAYKNALIADKLLKLSPEEKAKVVNKLLENRTEQNLADELKVSRTYVHDMKTMRQKGVKTQDRISLSVVYQRICKINSTNFSDWGRLEMIKEKCEELLKNKK